MQGAIKATPEQIKVHQDKRSDFMLGLGIPRKCDVLPASWAGTPSGNLFKEWQQVNDFGR